MKRLQCLDGLRGVLAVYVLLGHMAPFAAGPRWLAQALSHGGAAVDMFFMLSGLVILRSLEGVGFQARPFLIARIARIFPVYLTMLAVALCVQALPADYARMPWIASDSPAREIWSSGWPDGWATQILLHLAMLHGVVPDGVLPGAWVSFLGSAWSLSTEWQFYVLAVLLAGRLGARRVTLLLLALSVLGVAWRFGAPAPWQFSRAFLPNKAQHFALGVAGAVLLRRDRGAVGFYATMLLASLVLSLPGGPEKLLPPLAWTLCLTAQLYPAEWGMSLLARSLCWPGLLRLGGWSYGIYLANEPIQKALGVALAWLAAGQPLAFTLLWVPGAILLPVLAAAWLHQRIEMPALRLGRTLAARGPNPDGSSMARRRPAVAVWAPVGPGQPWRQPARPGRLDAGRRPPAFNTGDAPTVRGKPPPHP